jgi:hypothetical protein
MSGEHGAFDFTAARTRGDLGTERAAARAERTEPGWVDRAVEAVRDFAKGPGPFAFTIEEARARFKAPEGTDLRAWGQVTRRAVALGIIEWSGDFAPAVSSNGSPKRLYRKGPAA